MYLHGKTCLYGVKGFNKLPDIILAMKVWGTIVEGDKCESGMVGSSDCRSEGPEEARKEGDLM